MTEPEIARRCSSCGASIRVRAFFCPQCGKEVKPKSDSTPSQDAQEEFDAPKPASLADTVDLSIGGQSDSQPVPSALPTAFPHPPAQPLKYGAHRDLPNAGSKSRQVIGEAHGVEKWVQISTAMLDEASYDPSLRFVLVAAVLFILFLVVLILSELIT